MIFVGKFDYYVCVGMYDFCKCQVSDVILNFKGVCQYMLYFLLWEVWGIVFDFVKIKMIIL